MAFWSYDLFPFVLAAHVESMRDDGFVRVVGYPGMAFKPLAILPRVAGEKLWEQIKTLKVARAAEQDALNDRWNHELDELAPFVRSKR